jgi:hypothetical protein
MQQVKPETKADRLMAPQVGHTRQYTNSDCRNSLMTRCAHSYTGYKCAKQFDFTILHLLQVPCKLFYLIIRNTDNQPPDTIIIIREIFHVAVMIIVISQTTITESTEQVNMKINRQYPEKTSGKVKS